MKSTRRILALVLCLLMCMALFPLSASAAGSIQSSGTCGAGLEFVLYNDGELVINGTGSILPMSQWSFTGGYNFAQDDVLATKAEIKTLVIEEGATQIMDTVFMNCPKLSAIILPKSLVYIGQGAFSNCSGLTSVILPNGIQIIDAGAFQGCTGLVELYLPEGAATISANAFADCTALTSVTFPANIQLIRSQSFANCNSLKTIVFTGNYTTGLIETNAFQNVKATVYYPVDNDSWNQLLNPINNPAGADFGGRLTWKASATTTSSNGWVQKNGAWYYYLNGVMVRENWVAYNGFWFYFDENGRMVQDGHHLIDGKYYYLDPATGARQSGWRNNRFYDDNGVWQPAYSGVNDGGLNFFRNGWQQSSDGKWFYIKNQAKVKGWLKSAGYWYYLDPTTGAMVTGWLTVNGKTYYLRPLEVAVADGIPDKEGSMVEGRSEMIGGTYYTFDSTGALIGGKIGQNPMGLVTGFRQELDPNGNPGGGWHFYRSDGTMVKNGWELVGGKWYYFDKNGNMKTGWLEWNGSWYYLTPKNGSGNPQTSTTGQMVTGFQLVPVTKNGINAPKTYYFKSNGALNGKGWIKQNNKWYYLNDDGTIATGWFREGSKWYYLRDDTNPIGEMVTGVFNVPATLADGTPNNPNGTQSFKANGEWIGAGSQIIAGTAGKWGKDTNGKWHWYDTNGNPVTGWQLIDKKWYYLNPSSTPAGVMVTGFQNIDGQRFYFNADGALQAGWQMLDGVWYYFNPNHDGNYGAMRFGWQMIKGEWYYLDPTTGACQTGWTENPSGSNTWYYLNTANEGTYGAMHGGGWFELGGKKFYLNPNHDGTYGRQMQGWQAIGGEWYYFQETTNPAEGWMVTGRRQIDGKWYYLYDDGHMARNVTIDGHTYGSDGAEI